MLRSAVYQEISKTPLCGASFIKLDFLAISFGRVVVPSNKIVINIPRTYEKLTCQREPNWFIADRHHFKILIILFRREHESMGMLEYDKTQEEKVLRALILDLKPKVSQLRTFMERGVRDALNRYDIYCSTPK